jgi:hypothetical protein
MSDSQLGAAQNVKFSIVSKFGGTPIPKGRELLV